MNTQKQMFWQAHKSVTMENAHKNLKMARKMRHDAVKQWREDGADDEKFNDYVKDADEKIEIAENIVDYYYKAGYRASI